MRAKRERIAGGRTGPRKRIFRSIDEYEQVMQRPPDIEDAEEFIQDVEEEFGPQPDIREELRREGRL